MYGFIHREESLYGTLVELLRHTLFMLRSCIGRVPPRFKVVQRQTYLLCRGADGDCLRFHLKLASAYGIQLRPVTYRGICDLTHLYLISYSQLDTYFNSLAPSSLRRRIQLQNLPFTECSAEPFCENTGI